MFVNSVLVALVVLVAGCTSNGDDPSASTASQAPSPTSTLGDAAATAWGHKYVLGEAVVDGTLWSPEGGRELRVEMRSGLSMQWGLGCNKAHSVRANEQPAIIDQRVSREAADCGEVITAEEAIVNAFMAERLTVSVHDDGRVDLVSTESGDSMTLVRFEWETLSQ
ncbi:MAG: hypothetical protein GY720_20880 [bacterium]|nr:hypothetical protein [bacterium]